jgi:predicted nucleic-acid-binding Zn-ribbon protein
MSTDTSFEWDELEPNIYVPTPEMVSEPVIEESEMPKKDLPKCPKCQSDNLYVDSLVKKEWQYDSAILGDKEVEKPFERVTCLACGHVEDKL